MKIRVNNLLPILVMLILAALTLWLRQAAEQTAGDERRASDTEPEAIVQNLSIVRLDANGLAQYSMSARRMLHFAADDSTVLETPRFERRDGDGVMTTVTANRGKLSAGSKEAFFYGDVRLDRSASGKQGPIQARTEFLHIIPAEDLVRTDKHVTLTSRTSSLSGVGMVINKAKGQISLQSQVKGSYHAARK